MMKQEIKDFYEENKSYTIAFIVLAIVCLSGVWLVHDYTRNEPVYNNTDDGVEQLEKRIDDAEQRLDRVQERNQQSQETVTGIAESITDSRKQSEAITGSVDRAEQRLDSATQRLGRIQNRIADIEAEYRKGKTNP